jgi:hypothetical protein
VAVGIEFIRRATRRPKGGERLWSLDGAAQDDHQRRRHRSRSCFTTSIDRPALSLVIIGRVDMVII